MARKAKPPASVLVFSGSRWASLDETFAWAEGALGSSALAEDDLTERFRDGRLPIAMMRHGGMFELLEPSLRKRLWVAETEEEGVLTIRVWGLPAEIASSAPHFFVEREPLEQLYSPGLVIEPTPDAPAEASGVSPANPSPPAEPKVEQDVKNLSSKGIPGRRPTRDWPIVVAVEVVRLARDGALERPTSTYMIEHCSKKINFSPPVKQMQLLLKTLWP